MSTETDRHSGETLRATLIEGGTLCGQESKGTQAILFVGRHIAAVGEEAREIGNALPESRVRTHSAEGMIVAPGLVDAHVHFLGGGGFAGPTSRSPALSLTDFTLNGITTAVGAPGTDMVSRSMDGLLAKAYALESEGITAHIYSGGFHRPLHSLTGTVWRDPYLLPAVRGVKLAVGEPKAPTHSQRELIDLARELHWVEAATGRPVVLHVHLGPDQEGHDLLTESIDGLPRPDRLVVTHCNRSSQHLETAQVLAEAGAWIDMTCMISPHRGFTDSVRPAEAILELAEQGVSTQRMTLSTDGNGSAPLLGADGQWEEYVTHMDSLIDEVRALHASGMEPSRALAFAASNPAESMGMEGAKGSLDPGSDADVMVLTPDLRLRDLFARGVLMVEEGAAVVMGRYEAKATRTAVDSEGRGKETG